MRELPPPAHREAQPRLEDDRRAVVLVLLDGLGDRPQTDLGGLTPLEAARLPVLDKLARRGACGLHVPFGPGRAAASEVAHWAIFGYEAIPFCGRAVLEALGHGLAVNDSDPRLYTALRTSESRDGAVWITGRAEPDDEADARRLLAALPQIAGDHIFELEWMRLGEGILRLPGASAEAAAISDSDPFFEDRQPWLLPLPLAGAESAAAAAAAGLAEYLRAARAFLASNEINAVRVRRGLPALDTLTTKWAGARRPLPTFQDRVGMAGALVSSSALYRGFARLLAMKSIDVITDPDPGRDLAGRLAAAADLLQAAAAFVHVHTKVVDEAGHSRRPDAKRRVLEALDPALAALLEPPFNGAVVAVTGDHATPSSGGVLHTGDPTPLLVIGGAVRPDAVRDFSEAGCASGSIGTIRAADLLPLLLGHANRARFLGARATAHDTLGFPDHPEPLLL
ncbi:MAG: phosphoglycerate mutase [Candidatus Dormibacteraeota bacterium]|uniref:Phosphoglycerate mutase n=1 Tax=Candidatus Dormiibacter inghamiae TaxID=3127013 RepID=A0A934KKR6_9BACT|nr:phosphoglycerate mutase [Candidatus Dormibacteraeota bacterium]MBJ7606303.1 phosphoglycerate mutase [Candidatus Dormibacteraeota bacterium]